MRKIFRVISLIFGICILTVVAYLQLVPDEDLKDIPREYLFLAALMGVILTTLPIVFKGKKLSEDEIKRIVEAVKFPTTDLNKFLDGLPETENKKLRGLFKKGQDEEARASKIAEAIQQGNKQAAQQYQQATQKAIEYYRQGLAANPKTSERCALYNLIGIAHYRISQLDEAKTAWEEVRGLADEMMKSDNTEVIRDGKIFFAASSGNLGVVYKTRGDLDKAEAMYQQALNIFMELGNKIGIAIGYGNLGIVYQKRSDLNAAEEMYRKSLNLHEKLGCKEGMAIQYGDLGNIYKTRDNLIKAEDCYRQALKLFTEIGAKDKIVLAQSALRAIGKEP
ncbi:MAG: tetratricopeptide repeat protein [bacterium]|nr:tetratricopeptide repeat protein [bacterium]